MTSFSCVLCPQLVTGQAWHAASKSSQPAGFGVRLFKIKPRTKIPTKALKTRIANKIRNHGSIRRLYHSFETQESNGHQSGDKECTSWTLEGFWHHVINRHPFLNVGE